VLVARPAFAPAAFPSSVVVGIDGSAHAMAALDVAKALVGEGGGRGTAVAARGCDMAQDALARLAAPLAAEVRTERAVDALVEAAATADLLVVGARGVTGLASLGSVSERVAHRAESSVLVVRTGG
jgi:nucleotide-binding universal stress UspA family protein